MLQPTLAAVRRLATMVPLIALALWAAPAAAQTPERAHAGGEAALVLPDLHQATFLGGIDISHAMPGRRDDVINETKLRISQLAPGGGYILAPSNHLQADVPPENVVTLFETAHEFGRYPIKV